MKILTWELILKSFLILNGLFDFNKSKLEIKEGYLLNCPMF